MWLILYLPNSQRREVLLQTTWAEFFLILNLDTTINKGTERILFLPQMIHSFTEVTAKWNWINWFFCDNIWDFFYIDQLQLLTWVIFDITCLHQHQSKQNIPCYCRKDPVNNRGNCPAELNQLIIFDFFSFKCSSPAAKHMRSVLSDIIYLHQK